MVTQLHGEDLLMVDSDKSAVAFNSGSDARLVGQPETANPYDTDVMRDAWLSGWNHCDSWWGSRAKKPVAALPKIKR